MENQNTPPSPKPVGLNQIDFERLREMSAENPGLLPYPHTMGSALVKPEDMNNILARSLGAMEQQTEMQMQQIVAQMKLLADQAEAIQKRKLISERIFKADMRFEPLIAHTYYLYQKGGRDILSLVAPGEWGRKAMRELTFVATVVLLADHTWDVRETANNQ